MSAALRAAGYLALAVVLAGCGSWNVGEGLFVENARVTRVIETGRLERQGLPSTPFQRLEVELESGPHRGSRVTLMWAGYYAMNDNGLLREGDPVLVNPISQDGSPEYAIREIVRLPAVLPFAALLLVVIVAVSGRKGIASILGLVGSVAIFLLAIIPSVRRGDDPLGAALLGAGGLLLVSIYLVHGLNRKSTAAVLGAAGGLVVVGSLAGIGLGLAHITGLATEESLFLSVAGGAIEMPRLVLAGVLVASLGALVDMTVGQSSTTFELASVDPTLRGRRLYASALNVGRDHIGSLMNTLALAYFGSTLPLLVLLSVGYIPLAVTSNMEVIVGAILAVLVTSTALVLSVPLTTLIAVWLIRRWG